MNCVPYMLVVNCFFHCVMLAHSVKGMESFVVFDSQAQWKQHVEFKVSQRGGESPYLSVIKQPESTGCMACKTILAYTNNLLYTKVLLFHKP